jgi:hypothetical protein
MKEKSSSVIRRDNFVTGFKNKKYQFFLEYLFDQSSTIKRCIRRSQKGKTPFFYQTDKNATCDAHLL